MVYNNRFKENIRNSGGKKEWKFVKKLIKKKSKIIT